MDGTYTLRPLPSGNVVIDTHDEPNGTGTRASRLARTFARWSVTHRGYLVTAGSAVVFERQYALGYDGDVIGEGSGARRAP